VPTESAPWGDFRGVIFADHADEIGQFADDANLPFQHGPFYEDEVERLAGLGH
jgi:hypothetical protein